jgi:hypothetical protein
VTGSDEDAELKEFKTFVLNGDMGARSKKPTIQNMRKLWPYFKKTPGEQISYEEFGKLLGGSTSSGATNMLSVLVKNGVIAKVAGGSGRKGVGFLCNWLEERRGAGAPPPSSAGASRANGTNGTHATASDTTRDELLAIEDLAERGVQVMRPLVANDSPTGLSMTEILREIQSRVNRARSCGLKRAAVGARA